MIQKIISCIRLLFLTCSYGLKEEEAEEFSLGNSIAITLTGLTARGWTTTPNNNAPRLVFLTYVNNRLLLVQITDNTYFIYRIMTFCLLLNVAWNANLISYLATTNIQFPFDRLETLLRETDFKIGILPGSAHMDNFALSTKPNYVKAWKERIEPFLNEYKPYQGNLIP